MIRLKKKKNSNKVGKLPFPINGGSRVVHNFPNWLWNQQISPFIFEKWEKYFKIFFFQLKPMEL